MGWQNWQQKAKEHRSCTMFIETFSIVTVALLSLSVPLSFLLLARLSCYNYVLTVTSYPTQPAPSPYFYLLIYINPAIVYALVSILSIATLVHGLKWDFFLLHDSPGAIYRPSLYTWFLLCILQICVGLGIEGSMAAGIDSYSCPPERTMLSRVIFFLGLHETMLHWCRTVVKPVVDDTVFGVARDETWVQRVITAVSFGTLWWWKLRDEIESLAILAEAKLDVLVAASVSDLVGWWLYYLTVTIGMVRVVKSLIWLAMFMLCRRITRHSADICGHEDKV